MATVQWVGNAIATFQVDTLTVTAAVNNGIITVTINGKPISYTMTGADTTTTAAAALTALLSASTAPAEFQEVTWTSVNNVISATSATQGQPFTCTIQASGGAGFTQAHTTPNSSPSDVGIAANWTRLGIPALPQFADDMVIADSTVPLLWNLQALAAVQLNSFSRWQSFTGTIGLPEINASGYVEYRPTYFQFIGVPTGSSSSSAGPNSSLTPGNNNAISVILGQGTIGTGPTRERYDFQSQRVNVTVLNSGSAQDSYAIRLLGSNGNNVVTVLNTSVGMAMLPTESAALASATIGSGGTLDFGFNVSFSGALTMNGGSSTLNCAPASITANNGAQVTATGNNLTYQSVTARNGASLSWITGGQIVTLNLLKSSTFDKSQDLRPLTITNCTVDSDTCVINDPNSVVTLTNGFLGQGQVTSGPFLTGPNRTWRVQ